MKTYILYHANCTDGFMSAYIAWRKFADEVDYIPVSYNQPPPIFEPQSRIYILDFSYPRPIMEDLIENHIVTVLDHHKSAEQELKDLPDCIFNMHQSGAMMTWDYFFPNLIPNSLISYVQDRDLWTWKLPNSREINASLQYVGKTFENYDLLMRSTPINQLIKEGTLIREIEQYWIEKIAHNAHRESEEIIRVNSPILQSELGEYLSTESLIADIWYEDKNGNFQHSLRSKGDLDVSVLARQFGGGGHKNAAGFTEPSP